MHGLGNDFAVFDARMASFALDAVMARRIADRRRGIGCDQIIVIGPGVGGADACMQILNADGSEVEACGNATRCVARILLAETGKDAVGIRTKGGLLTAKAAGKNLYSVDMGQARTDWADIPLAEAVDTNRFILQVGTNALEAAAVSMGNPHCVLFVDDAESADVAGIGPAVETHAMFPRRTNVEFVSVQSETVLRMRVWERGVGITQACGSGACAAAFAAFRRGLTGPDVQVILDGGALRIGVQNGRLRMTGPAAQIYSGVLDLQEL